MGKSSISIVWKLSALIILIVSVVIAISGIVNTLICSKTSIDSVRTVMEANSDSILRSVEKVMTSGEFADGLYHDLLADPSVYGRIWAYRHKTGEAAFGTGGAKKSRNDRLCQTCHGLENPAEGLATPNFHEIVDQANGGRTLFVTTPIRNRKSCSTTECHESEESMPVLGFLEADYPLENVDELISWSRTLTLIAVAAAVLCCTGALWLAFNRYLGKSFRILLKGIGRIADNDLAFRFKEGRKDEIGILARSFNSMTTRILAHQEELRSATEYLEGIIESSADMIITVNPSGRIQTFNRGAEETLGYRRDEIVGQRVEGLFANPSERNVAIARLKNTDNVLNYQTRFVTNDGEILNVLLTLSRLRDPEGNAIGTFGISKDITRELLLQKKLIQSEKFVAIGQAVTGIQHAIKNMLNALKGGAYLVEIGLKNDQRDRLNDGWDMVKEGISRISSLSMNLLNYVKEWRPELDSANLDALLGKVRDVIVQSARDKGVDFRMECPEPVPRVICDPRLIHMAVMDLVSNALDACKWKDYEPDDKPEVVLSLFNESTGRKAVIEVRDNGCGMNDEIRKNIFAPFFSTKKKWGTGLGLALSSRIINVHGGKITVESEPDRGTTFRIILPVEGPGEKKESGDGQEGSDNR